MAKMNDISSRIKGVYGTMYQVKDMAKAVEFFAKTLGQKPSFESPEWTEFSLPGQRFCLCASTKEEAPRSGILILQVDDLKAVREALKAGGLPVSDVGDVHGGAKACDFTDPEGHAVGLYQAP
jgi:predicted enzyme related to lactoylglutathione lyase